MLHSVRPPARCALSVALAAIAALAGNQAQAAERPFFGSVSGEYFPFERAYFQTGNATHLGTCGAQFVLRQSAPLLFPNLENYHPFHRTADVTLVSADGSALFGSIFFDQYDADTLMIAATMTITSGSGRLAGATGTIDVLLVFSDTTFSRFEGLLDGTVDY